MDWHIHWDVIVILALIEGAYLLAVGPWRHRFVHAEIVRATPRQIALFSLGVFAIFAIRFIRWAANPDGDLASVFFL